jgi:hypothetical protein
VLCQYLNPPSPPHPLHPPTALSTTTHNPFTSTSNHTPAHPATVPPPAATNKLYRIVSTYVRHPPLTNSPLQTAPPSLPSRSQTCAHPPVSLPTCEPRALQRRTGMRAHLYLASARAWCHGRGVRSTVSVSKPVPVRVPVPPHADSGLPVYIQGGGLKSRGLQFVIYFGSADHA